MKVCNSCGQSKDSSDFYRHPHNLDGLLGRCKTCHKLAIRHNRRIKAEYYRAYDRERGNRQGYDYVKEYRASNPEKYQAQTKLNNAVRDGRIEKLRACEKCGGDRQIEAHHHDYSRPLDVQWLCAACHKIEHADQDCGEIVPVKEEQNT